MFFKRDQGVEEAKKHQDELEAKAKKAKDLVSQIQTIEKRIQICELRRRQSTDSKKYEILALRLGMLKSNKERELKNLNH